MGHRRFLTHPYLIVCSLNNIKRRITFFNQSINGRMPRTQACCDVVITEDRRLTFCKGKDLGFTKTKSLSVILITSWKLNNSMQLVVLEKLMVDHLVKNCPLTESAISLPR
jgi:hypothetical protein